MIRPIGLLSQAREQSKETETYNEKWNHRDFRNDLPPMSVNSNTGMLVHSRINPVQSKCQIFIVVDDIHVGDLNG